MIINTDQIEKYLLDPLIAQHQIARDTGMSQGTVSLYRKNNLKFYNMTLETACLLQMAVEERENKERFRGWDVTLEETTNQEDLLLRLNGSNMTAKVLFGQSDKAKHLFEIADKDHLEFISAIKNFIADGIITYLTNDTKEVTNNKLSIDLVLGYLIGKGFFPNDTKL